MISQIKKIALTITTIFVMSCNKSDDTPSNFDTLHGGIEEIYGSLSSLKLPDSDEYMSIPSDPKNRITAKKVALGKFLFHETALATNPIKEAGKNTYSCASCHHAKAGFQSGMKQGIGEGGFGFGLKGEIRTMASDYDNTEIDIQPIRSPTILNTAYQEVMLWNGQFGATGINNNTQENWTTETPKATNLLGFEGLEIQAIAGLDVHRMSLSAAIIQNEIYKQLFDDAFPEIINNERYTLKNAGLAIAAFERTVLTNEAPFQKWLKGDKSAMNETEINGAIIFFGKGKCYTCHSGPGLNGMEFHALGMNDLKGNDVHGNVDEVTSKGRGGFTNNIDDDYKFKTPTLYNLKDVKHLGHGGNFNTVKEVIEYKNEAIAQNSAAQNNLSSKFVPLGLSSKEIDELTAFIEVSLYDPYLDRYVPENTPLKSCFPNADSQSKIDMGCN